MGECAMLPPLFLHADRTCMHACSGREDDDMSMCGSDDDVPACGNDDDAADAALYEIQEKEDQLKTYMDSLYYDSRATPAPILEAKRILAVLDELTTRIDRLDKPTLDRLASVLNGVLVVLSDYKNATIALEQRGDPSLLPVPIYRDGYGFVSRYDIADVVAAVAISVLGNVDRYKSAMHPTTPTSPRRPTQE